MKAIDDRYAALKSDFSLNQAAYAALTLDQLEQRIIKWAASQKILSASGPSASASASAAKPFTPASTPYPTTASSTGTPTITTETITKAVKDNKCVCSNCRHKLVKYLRNTTEYGIAFHSASNTTVMLVCLSQHASVEP